MPNSLVGDLMSRIIPSNFGVQLWVNSRSGFEQGIISPQEAPALIDELSQYLLSQRDVATGEPIYSAVHLGQNIYDDPNAHEGPDLMVEYSNFFTLEGGHAMNGMFMAQGPAIHAIHANQVSGTGLEDLAPTLLHLLDQPISLDMDGRVLVEIFNQNYLTEHPIQIRTPLRQLGYID